MKNIIRINSIRKNLYIIFMMLGLMVLCCACQKNQPESANIDTVEQQSADEDNGNRLSDVKVNEEEERKDIADRKDTSSEPDNAKDSLQNPADQSVTKDSAPDPADQQKDNGFTNARPSVTGKLKVTGNQMTDQQGNPVQLKGISTHGLAWFPQYINQDCFSQLAKDWNANVIRLAMYTDENDGYCTDGDKKELKELVESGVDYATKADMYVIIDWHVLKDNNPNTYKEDAIKFFDEMSKNYSDHNNILYEICNEPNGDTSWDDIKKYAEAVIPVIRANDPDSIIIVGTPTWSQRVDEVALHPITGENIMYTLHYYAATHKEDLRQVMSKAVDAGLPVFVTEYGICDASGNGQIDEQQAQAWVDLMNQYKISYVAWNLSNKNETSAILKPECAKVSGFEETDLSDSGKWLYHMLTADKDSNTGSTNESKNDKSSNDKSGPDKSGTDKSGTEDTTQSGDKDVQTTDGYVLKLSNSWEVDGKYYYQYELNVNNTTQKDLNNWSVSIKFSDKPAISDSWNANMKVIEDKLEVKPVDYNSTIKVGESAKNIGFIISGSKDLKIMK